MQVQPYLFFDGRCEEAAEYCQRKLGAEIIMLMRWKDMPEPQQPGTVSPDNAEKVMHMSLRIGETTVLCSDGSCQGKTDFQGFALSLTVAGEAEAKRGFAALADGGEVQMPLGKTFFSPQFGMVKDRFGVSWMVYVASDVGAVTWAGGGPGFGRPLALESCRPGASLV